ncbi:RluA family pseudouridine synthase [Oribacterium sp. FC2011]|uniref:RluA family pseudouridine synthase n=1 Tax=Oribacterium sp. FC2011 TaxID=1408311 RepID=UPI0004E0CF73|nr:RluA family pseudouridine synthase [Oribacterium sp. FC2011]
MKELHISLNESGQRLDKLLHKYLSNANTSFIYKMLRKKNIVLNDKKAEGKEILKEGDSVKIYFSDETFAIMTGGKQGTGVTGTAEKDTTAAGAHENSAAKKDHKTGIPKKSIYRITPEIRSELNLLKQRVIYEDKHLLVIDKPAGWISQSDDSGNLSVNELCLMYLIEKGELTEKQLETFKPSIANRLDRNTSGLILFGKTLPALQSLAELLRKRTAQKYYLAIVNGRLEEAKTIKGYLSKNEKLNKVVIKKERFENSSEINTAYEPLKITDRYTVLKVHLITGKTHQIRAHLSSIGHSIIGDPKYGDPKVNSYYKKKYSLDHQLLHSWQLKFPEDLSGVLEPLAGKTLTAEPPKEFLIEPSNTFSKA